MKKFSIVLAVFFFSGAMLFASNKEKPNTKKLTTVVSGTVVDKTSGEYLAGVAIKIEGTNIIVYSDFDGKFQIPGIKPGSYKIESELISYKQKIKEIKVDLSSESEVKLRLESL